MLRIHRPSSILLASHGLGSTSCFTRRTDRCPEDLSGPAFPLPEKPAAAPGAHVRAPHLPSRSPTPRRTQKRHLVLAIPGALGGGANAGITALQAMGDRAAAAAAISTGLFMHDPTI